MLNCSHLSFMIQKIKNSSVSVGIKTNSNNRSLAINVLCGCRVTFAVPAGIILVFFKSFRGSSVMDSFDNPRGQQPRPRQLRCPAVGRQACAGGRTLWNNEASYQSRGPKHEKHVCEKDVTLRKAKFWASFPKVVKPSVTLGWTCCRKSIKPWLTFKELRC